MYATDPAGCKDRYPSQVRNGNSCRNGSDSSGKPLRDRSGEVAFGDLYRGAQEPFLFARLHTGDESAVQNSGKSGYSPCRTDRSVHTVEAVLIMRRGEAKA